MLNSFLNLCRVCPSMPIDKLHSEYRTNFKWHDTYHTPIHEDVHKGADATVCCEPALPRRKKYPELAYRSHEVLRMANGGGESSDSLDDSLNCKDNETRARSELRNQGRGAGSPRSKSVDPYLSRRRPLSAVIQLGTAGGAGMPSSRQQMSLEHRLLYRRSRLDCKPPDHLLMTQSFPPAAHVQLPPPVGTNGPESGKSSSKVIRKSTEYRSQFAWPQLSSESIPQADQATSTSTKAPRKSISMGAIEVDQQVDKVDRGQLPVEEEIIVDEKIGGKTESRHNLREDIHPQEDTVEKRKLKKIKTEYKSKFRAPSKYMYTNGSWKAMSRSAESTEILQDAEITEVKESWYDEVAELRRKAGEYKCRSVVGNFPIPNSRQEMIEQVSLRSNLSALALATTPREKDKEEQSKLKKSLLNEQAKRERGKSSAKAKTTATTTATSSTTTKHIPPHHPHTSVVKQSKRIPVGDSDSHIDGHVTSGRTSQATVRHHLERTTPTSGETGVLITSPTRDHKLEPVQLQRNRSSKKESKGKSAQRSTSRATDEPSTRASSITPTGRASAMSTHKSPKRAARPMSMIVPGSKSIVNSSWNGTQEPLQKSDAKHPRPTTLATSTTARPKTAPAAKSEAPAKVHLAGHSKAVTKPSSTSTKIAQSTFKPEHEESKTIVNGNDEQSRIKEEIDAAYRLISSKCQETLENNRNKEEDDELQREIEETIKLRSPPEPTRVKSPEQIMVKSPETVNWTIPLETRIKWTSGPTKTEGEEIIQPLSEQEIYDNERLGYGERIKSPPLISSPVQNPSAVVVTSQPVAQLSKISPSSESSQMPRSPSLTSPLSGRSLASDVLEKARTRFDQFWGKSKDK